MPSRLEQYLDEVSRPVPVSDRLEWRMEAEQHLTALIAAYEELGHSREEATELALVRFGEAGELGRRMEVESAAARRLPWQLKGVSLLFAFQGLMCWAITVPRFLKIGIINEALLVWGAPALFIAWGLMKRSAGWRRAAISLICATLLLTVPMTLIGPNWVVGEPPLLGAWRVLMYVMVPAWELWVLTRPEIKTRFEPGKPKRRFWARR